MVITGVWLWWRRRNFGHRMKHVPVSKLETFDIDDESPLQKTSLFNPKKLSTSSSETSPSSSTGQKSASSSIIARTFHLGESTSDLALASKITSFDTYPHTKTGSATAASSSRSTLDGRSERERERDRVRDRERDRDREPSKTERRRRGDRTRARNAYGQLPQESDEQGDRLPSERSRGKRARRRREHERDHDHHDRDRNRDRDRSAIPSGDAGDSRQHRARKKHGRARRGDERRYSNVIRLNPIPAVPKRNDRGRKRSFRNSRIMRAGYNLFFAQPGSSNSGSAYAPSTVLTSEISERPANTLSPVSEVSLGLDNHVSILLTIVMKVPPPMPIPPSPISIHSLPPRPIIANRVDGDDDD